MAYFVENRHVKYYGMMEADGWLGLKINTWKNKNK
jgi:hypothetical protein